MRCHVSSAQKSEHDLSEKLGLEDHAACACAIQNFMLSLAEEGIGSKWMTGALAPPRPAEAEDVMAAVGAPAGEKLVGAIWYGTPLGGEGFGRRTRRRRRARRVPCSDGSACRRRWRRGSS